MNERPYILTIAGFDPSGGAGLMADIKTIEMLKGYGLAVCTANTVQNDIVLKNCHWIEEKVIQDQIAILLGRFKIEVVKIGIVQNWKILNSLIDFLLTKNDKIKIVLDPVLRSSSGFDFQGQTDKEWFEKILGKIYLLTPNYEEIQKLYPSKTIIEAVDQIKSKTHVLLKGGHRLEALGKDELYTRQGEQYDLNPLEGKFFKKHGSGCILSSAIATYLALEVPLLDACIKAKRYTERVLSSTNGLLGYHGV